LKIIKKNKIKKVIEISDEIADGKEILLEIPQKYLHLSWNFW
jgi:hypothetical protein